MKGLDLAEEYYREYGAPMIEAKFVSFKGRVAAGLVGPGSECFGFDDEISKDHDWGPGFCLWLTTEDFKEIGPDLQREYEKLPRTFKGFGPRIASPGEEWRVGVAEITTFYKRYTGLDHPPETFAEWLSIPEKSLALCTNGRLFSDPLGSFSKWRNTLLDFYPEDVRLKKLASRCMTVAQAGQYNFVRSIKRNELFAAQYAQVMFCADLLSLIFLLNRKFPPFYKWMHRAVKDLPILGQRIHTMISELLTQTDDYKKQLLIEEMCGLVIAELNAQNLSDSDSDFLLDHAHQVHNRIKDKELGRRLSLTV